MARTNRTRPALLGILSLGPPMSGYDIKKVCETAIAHIWNESFGQIYPTLTKLEEEGLVRQQGDGDGSARTLYTLTAKGRSELQAWLRQPSEPRRIRDEFHLKLFFGGELSPADNVEHVRRHQQQIEAQLDELTGHLEATRREYRDHPSFAYWESGLLCGIEMCEVKLQWCERTRRRFQRLARDGVGRR